MKRVLFLIVFILAMLTSAAAFAAEGQPQAVAWQGWTEDLFEKAKAENKFVLLDLEAVWCHWCHVMDETTYKDPRVIGLIQKSYIPVRVDQDSRPDLSNRYENYGWPATVFFGTSGEEIAKRRGYIPPDGMVSILEAIIKDPTPGPSVTGEGKVTPSENAFLDPAQAKIILNNHGELYDKEFGGWGSVHKLIDSDQLEYALVKAQAGDKEEEQRARTTLDQALGLQDPVWGGFFQYSDERNWKSPHFERIMSIQAAYLRIYSLGFLYFGKPEYLQAAQNTAKYLKNFLTGPDGAFYTSQDADLHPGMDSHPYYALEDAKRRELGVPRIDRHVYARENGWAMTGLLSLYEASGDIQYLEQATRAAKWILANRGLAGGGFRHDEKDAGGPYLGDTLAMGRAFLAFYAATGERDWLVKSQEAAEFIEKNFRDPGEPGYVSSVSVSAKGKVFERALKHLDEHIALVRFANYLYHYTGDKKYRAMAEHAMRYLASPDLIQNNKFMAGALLADRELAEEPVHVAVVGHKDDPAARALFLAALRYPASYKRVEWWDKREGAMPNPDVQYPELPKAAAFACAAKTCSLPVFDPAKVAAQVDRLRKSTN